MNLYSDLKRLVRGDVVVRGTPRFAAARRALTFNDRQPPREPAVILRAADAADVQAAVRYGAAHGLAVSPRGSGHNFSGVALQSGILLDLSALRDCVIDARAAQAEIGPGLTNREAARAFSAHRFAFPLGHCGQVAMSGYLLGGGIGWNAESWGIACHSVIGADVVLADGSLHSVSATQEPDIFWALRGGGPGFFGVVTRYRLALHPLPGAITMAGRFYPAARAGEVQDWMRVAKACLPHWVEMTAILMAAPPCLAANSAHVVLVSAVIFAETPARAEEAFALLDATAPAGALERNVAPVALEELYDVTDQSFMPGERFAVDSHWSDSVPPDYLARLTREVAAAPAPGSFALVNFAPSLGGGAAARNDAAFSVAGGVLTKIHACWQGGGGDDANIAWLRAAADALGPESLGHYVGEADLERPGRLTRCYAPTAWARLADLRRRHDPAGVFRRAFPVEDARRKAG